VFEDRIDIAGDHMYWIEQDHEVSICRQDRWTSDPEYSYCENQFQPFIMLSKMKNMLL
jgi:hypothetical protein